MLDLYLLYLAIFVAVFAAARLLLGLFATNPAQRRLQRVGAAAAPLARRAGWGARVRDLGAPLARLSAPEDAEDRSALRMRFLNAGWRGTQAPALFLMLKTLLALLLPGLAGLALYVGGVGLPLNLLMLVLLSCAAAGLYLPNLVLGRLIARRKLLIQEQLPNALDLMVVCVEAGLAVDAALDRVAQEMALGAPELSEELHLAILELRAGSSKEDALHNLALRTGVEEVELLATVLIQAERFGTSIADSLRVHAEGLRTRRRQRAEEIAAKLALKMLMPLMSCIFPALLLILLGPAVIRIFHALLPALGGQ